MITTNINGKTIQAEQGKTVIEAAEEAGIYIPSLCYHPDLPPIGACRLCIVEIEGMRGFPTSCTTEVREGMKIRTDTPEIQELRKKVLWLILSEHPADIEEGTQLAKVVEYTGINEELPEYVRQPRCISVVADEPLFIRDLERCILCGRCVGMCREVRGIGAIGLARRGMDTIVSTSWGSLIKDSGCKFCRACVEICPTGALKDKVEFDDTNKEKVLLPCSGSCPAGMDVSRYVRLIAENRFQDSLEVIRETVPLPHILGCVCTHPCEEKCFRDDINDPIAIKALKRFVAERDTSRWRDKVKIASGTGKKVAIVGSGPAGLTAAWFLRQSGHEVTVFEALHQPGGMMRTAIPKYRLPREVLDKEIEYIEDIGIKIQTDTRIGSVDELFSDGFDAIFLAIGATGAMKLGIPGEEDPHVSDGIKVLTAINLGHEIDISGDIAVVGGGNVAMDVARSVRRINSGKITVLYRRTRKEMPAAPEEIEEALEEGIEINFLTAPQKVSAGKNKLKIECIRMELGEPDSSGRRRPVPVKGSEFTVKTDRLITAIGQKTEVPEKMGVELTKWQEIRVDKETLATSKKGVYAGGDIVTGPDSVISAIQAGRVAADSIDKYLGGAGRVDQKFIPAEEEKICFGREEGFADRKRARMPVAPPKERIRDFREVELGLNEETAVKEASRCLKCQVRLKISKAPMPPKEK